MFLSFFLPFLRGWSCVLGPRVFRCHVARVRVGARNGDTGLALIRVAQRKYDGSITHMWPCEKLKPGGTPQGVKTGTRTNVTDERSGPVTRPIMGRHRVPIEVRDSLIPGIDIARRAVA